MERMQVSIRALTALTVLRIFIGWHFLYEGILKLFNPNWTAKGYLISAELFTGFYEWLSTDSMIGIVDSANIIILIVVGAALILGIFERSAVVLGIALLLMYYAAHPAFMSSPQLGAEGNYWLINKNLIEAAALAVLYQLPSSSFFGLQVFRKKNRNLKAVEL